MTPAELADRVRPVLGTALVGFDVDGVLAPIVEHADESELTDGVHGSLERLAGHTRVVILSGRSLESLERLFDFHPTLHVVGSHGLEERGDGEMHLNDDERRRFAQLEILGHEAVDAAGEGAWLEYKPASVVFHTRLAESGRARAAIDALTNLAVDVDGAHVKGGQEVVELLARHASKGEALVSLGAHLDRSPLVFFGDDLTDEDAFRRMSVDDISVKIGPGETAAKHRLAGPGDVAEFLRVL